MDDKIIFPFSTRYIAIQGLIFTSDLKLTSNKL